jgi:hypothetical protein
VRSGPSCCRSCSLPLTRGRLVLACRGATARERRLAMPDFNPFDMDLDRGVHGVDLLGLDHLIGSVLANNTHQQEGRAMASRANIVSSTISRCDGLRPRSS